MLDAIPDRFQTTDSTKPGVHHGLRGTQGGSQSPRNVPSFARAEPIGEHTQSDPAVSRELEASDRCVCRVDRQEHQVQARTGR